MISADTNLFVHAADPGAPKHKAAVEFFTVVSNRPDDEFVVCELVLVELYMQLRNPAVFKKPHSAPEAAAHCHALRTTTGWHHIDYDKAVSNKLWKWASKTKTGFREIIDARLALTLRHHGVTRFATANTKHFQGFGFSEVWNPLLS